jgi:hypothetical protein
MYAALAYADTTDPTQSNFLILLLCVMLIGCVCLMAFGVMFLARMRRHRHTEHLTVIAIFWALFAAGTLVYAAQTQLKWSHEHMLRLESGYGNPRDDADAPQLPWAEWVALAAVYGIVIIWSVSQKNLPPSSSNRPPDGPTR